MTKIKSIDELKRGDKVYIINPEEKCEVNPFSYIGSNDYCNFFADTILECEFLSSDYENRVITVLYKNISINILNELVYTAREAAQEVMEYMNMKQHKDNMRRIMQLENELERITKTLKSI